jgi:hypothetical protein
MHDKSKSKHEFWDHFSWFEILDENMQREIEALLLASLPFYLRVLNKQSAKFCDSTECKEIDSKVPQLKMLKRGPKRISRSSK